MTLSEENGIPNLKACTDKQLMHLRREFEIRVAHKKAGNEKPRGIRKRERSEAVPMGIVPRGTGRQIVLRTGLREVSAAATTAFVGARCGLAHNARLLPPTNT